MIIFKPPLVLLLTVTIISDPTGSEKNNLKLRKHEKKHYYRKISDSSAGLDILLYYFSNFIDVAGKLWRKLTVKLFPVYSIN